jgi:hypothetical protein
MSKVPETSVNSEDDEFLSRIDFFEFADTNGLDRHVAGLAWKKLTRLYSCKVNSGYLGKYEWYDSSRFRQVPLEFLAPKDTPWPNDILYPKPNNLIYLGLNGLRTFIGYVDEAVEMYGKSGYGKVFDGGVGAGGVEFIKDLVESRSAPSLQLEAS